MFIHILLLLLLVVCQKGSRISSKILRDARLNPWKVKVSHFGVRFYTAQICGLLVTLKGKEGILINLQTFFI